MRWNGLKKTEKDYFHNFSLNYLAIKMRGDASSLFIQQVAVTLHLYTSERDLPSATCLPFISLLTD